MNNVCVCTSFLVLVALADLSICTPGKLAELRGTLGAMATFRTWGALELTVGQSSFWTPLRGDGDVLAGRGVDASGKLAEPWSAYWAGAAVIAGGTPELTSDKICFRALFVAATRERRCKGICE